MSPEEIGEFDVSREATVSMIRGDGVRMPPGQDADLWMLDWILEVLEAGRYSGASEEKIRALHGRLKERRRAGDLEGLDTKEIFRSHPGLWAEVATAEAKKAIEYVRKEAERLGEIKKQREFTEAEKALALEGLIPLLGTLTELVSGKSQEGAESKFRDDERSGA